MQLQLNINDFKSNIFLEFLEVFKKDDIVKDYKIITKPKFNSYENELIEDIKNLNLAILENGEKKDKFVEICE